MSRPPSYQTWGPDSYAPRPPASHYPETPSGSFRLPPPASLLAGAPSGRGPPVPSSGQYQEQYVVSSDPRHSLSASRPSIAAAPPRQALSIQLDQTRRSAFPSSASSMSAELQDSRYSQPMQDRAAAPSHSSAFNYPQGSPGSDLRLDSQQRRQPASAAHPVLAPAPMPPPQEMARPSIGPVFRNPFPPNPPCPDNNVNYQLHIRQQPVAARSCGFGERDRRVIDPPPIVELLLDGPDLTQEERSARLRYCHYVMSCTIFDETGHRDASFMPEDYKQQRRLMGSLVAAPFVGQDEFNKEGCFFCFPDLSCRTPGAFRLKFSIVMIDPVRARKVKHFPVLVELMSDVFHVYNAKDFPGMQASTKLTKRLKAQGCIISIKKGNEKYKNSRGADDMSDGEEDDEDEGESVQRKRKQSSRR